MTDPKLERGEHVDLDSGIMVRRRHGSASDPDAYWVAKLATDDGFSIDREDIKTLAELAGFEVSD